jgi:hypothetical protein
MPATMAMTTNVLGCFSVLYGYVPIEIQSRAWRRDPMANVVGAMRRDFITGYV